MSIAPLVRHVARTFRALLQLPEVVERLGAVEVKAHDALTGVEDLESVTRELYIGDDAAPDDEQPMCDYCRDNPGASTCLNAWCLTNAVPAARRRAA